MTAIDPRARLELERFAAGLRELRNEAGSPTYRELAARSGLAPSTMWKAASGARFPSLRVTLEFVRACGGPTSTWHSRWIYLEMAVRPRSVERFQERRTRSAENAIRAAGPVAAELRAIVGHVSRAVELRTLTTSQEHAERERVRYRQPGSSRHLADVINASPGPVGRIGHARIARALSGDPRQSLDEALVIAIVGACYELCGVEYTRSVKERWIGRIADARASIECSDE
jgi:transcriptional regulator with XRE-family HTH domain